MFLEVKEEDLEPGKAYLMGTWPLDTHVGIERKDVGVFFGPISLHRLALDEKVMLERTRTGERVIAGLTKGKLYPKKTWWRVFATTDKNTPACQDFERISIYIEGEWNR